jgi:hypothetical protein
MDKQALIDSLLPLLNQALVIVGTALLAWIGSSVRKWAKATDERTKLERMNVDAEIAAFASLPPPGGLVRAVAVEASAGAARNATKLGYSMAEIGALGHSKAVQALAATNSIRPPPGPGEAP